MNSKVYKIRHKQTGLYSSGGSTPRWNARGKTWTSRGPLNAHLGLVMDTEWRRADMKNWEIVELEVREIGVYTVDNAIVDIQHKRIKRKEAQNRAIEKYQREEKERQFEKLKRELGK
jgi:hypothetical protein